MAERSDTAADGTLAAEMRAFLAEWARSNIAKDVTAASALRTEEYRASYPGNRVLLKADELAHIASDAVRLVSLRTELLNAAGAGGAAQIRFDMIMHARQRDGGEVRGMFRCEMGLVRAGGAWQARRLEARRVFDLQAAASAPEPRGLLRRIAGRLGRLASRALPGRDANFQELAYQPYRPGEDYLLPPRTPPPLVLNEADLPVPPPELWLGYDYLAHGAEHVRTMLAIAAASGFEARDGDRILDLGCGAGRMIRHLAPLAERCEIWGADISAEHIFWAKRHLSPPFHFLTNTKTPYLPFADGSFRFIYCGSLFTHIDDLADSWLLELRRLLAPGGRLYVTIHDEHTIALFDAWADPPPLVRMIRHAAVYAQAKHGFDSFTVGRDNHSQVFYARAALERMAGSAFEILSATEEAYFYQTAMLLAPR
jgi:SAM-dependent methyltransferase